jgi:FMN phosphatase YigB (HAD superfamily)
VDGGLEDVDGALAAGMHAVHLQRAPARGASSASVATSVRDLSELPGILAASTAAGAAGPAVLN